MHEVQKAKLREREENPRQQSSDMAIPKNRTGLLRSFHSLAMTGVNKDKDLLPYCLSALVPNKSEGKKTGGQEDRIFNKSCHPEFISGSVHSEKWNLPWSKMLKRVQHDKCAFTLSEGVTHVTSCPPLATLPSKTIKYRFARGLSKSLISRWGSKHVAFTLAEVLITLGIIGIVAAITIPTMMSNYRKKIKSTRLKHFYSTFTQAIRMQSGGDSTIDASMLNEAGNPDEMLEFVKTNYAPYMNLTVLKKSQYGVIVGFPDGSGAEFAKIGCTPKSTACTYIVFCPEYKDCAPSRIRGLRQDYLADSTKRFIFWTTSVPHTTKSLADRENFLVPNCKGVVPESPEYCTRLLQIDNCEFKKDYPFKI